jgi:aryl-alcohol dehydrogenase-like predicted oxidoreductase
MSKSATKEGTTRYAKKFAGRAAEGHFREVQRLVLSSLGMGTYLGKPDAKTDESYAASAVAAVENGINVLDAAINYRFQRSERNLGVAIQQLGTKGFEREEFVVCTKGGYLTPENAMPADPNDYFFREYIQPGIFTAKDIAAGSHCMTPKFLKNQLGRSLKNLGVECVDVYYLHNPETQLSEISKEEFLIRVREAFTFLESAVDAGEIQYYSMATWNGFRQHARAREAMQLAVIYQVARKSPVAGTTSASCNFPLI